MADYDFELAGKLVQKYSDLLEEASLGMAEDWYWTAETIYEEGKFTDTLSKEVVGGIKGAAWATPTVLLTFKDGTEKFLDCYKGCVTPEDKPDWFSLGELSQPAQEEIDSKLGKYLN